MNRIKEALEKGKAIYCRTEDEARRLFEVMGWEPDCGEFWYGRDDQCYALGLRALKWQEAGRRYFDVLGVEIVFFSTLARSRLAEALGVEDGQEFTYGSTYYRVTDDGKLWYGEAQGATITIVTDAMVLERLINHPDQIHPRPTWSEETKKDAQAALRMGFGKVERSADGELILSCEDDPHGYCVPPTPFPEIQPGQTVALREIR